MITNAFQKFNLQQAFQFKTSNHPQLQYTYCTFDQSLNISDCLQEIIMRACFKPLLMKFCEFFLSYEEQHKEMNIFFLSGSPGMGKSVFGIIFVLFIANAIAISNPNNQKINKDKFSSFFPEFTLNPSEKTKGYIILFCHHKLSYDDKCFVVQFHFRTNVWECIYEGNNPDVYRFSQKFPGYKCFFIFDSTTFMNEIDFSYFDGVIISIGSPKSIISRSELSEINNIAIFYYFYYPLWDDSEFEMFLNHFQFPNSFEVLKVSNNLDIISRMGLEHLKKTDVFGNSPRILIKTSACDVKLCLSGLTNALSNSTFAHDVRELCRRKLEDKNIDIAIHLMFFIKPTDDYEYFSIVPASNYIQCLINRYINYMSIHQASNNYHSSINNPPLRRINFQNYFHTYIFERMNDCVINLTSKYQYDGKYFKLQAFKKKTCIFTVSKYKEVDDIVFSDLVDGGFYCPKVFNFPTFDSVFRGTVRTGNKSEEVVFFFQCTVRKEHDINKKGYLVMKDCLEFLRPKEVSLVFVVPDTQEPFTPYLDSSLKEFNHSIIVYVGSFPIL
jgi:hypothetical protein